MSQNFMNSALQSPMFRALLPVLLASSFSRATGSINTAKQCKPEIYITPISLFTGTSSYTSLERLWKYHSLVVELAAETYPFTKPSTTELGSVELGNLHRNTSNRFNQKPLSVLPTQIEAAKEILRENIDNWVLENLNDLRISQYLDANDQLDQERFPIKFYLDIKLIGGFPWKDTLVHYKIALENLQNMDQTSDIANASRRGSKAYPRDIVFTVRIQALCPKQLQSAEKGL
ncbi:MAG: hypothetical protein C5B49_02185 [Bdellovibrio sp.]|nr:MAG: hypothetical protein C5B49_02185 [Bdellovibrio sp.]